MGRSRDRPGSGRGVPGGGARGGAEGDGGPPRIPRQPGNAEEADARPVAEGAPRRGRAGHVDRSGWPDPPPRRPHGRGPRRGTGSDRREPQLGARQDPHLSRAAAPRERRRAGDRALLDVSRVADGARRGLPAGSRRGDARHVPPVRGGKRLPDPGNVRRPSRPARLRARDLGSPGVPPERREGRPRVAPRPAREHRQGADRPRRVPAARQRPEVGEDAGYLETPLGDDDAYAAYVTDLATLRGLIAAPAESAPPAGASHRAGAGPRPRRSEPGAGTSA